MTSGGPGLRGLVIAGGVLASRAGSALLDAGKRGSARRLYVAVAIIGAGLYMNTGTAAANVSAGEASTCAVLSTGHVECWGENRWGQLGNATATGPETCSGFPCSRIPVEVNDITDATQVSVGHGFACARLSGGHVECWGFNDYGELGDGTTTGPETCEYDETSYPCSETPVEVTGITDATQVSAGVNQACALLSSRRVECWGDNAGGQLGDGTTTDSDTPVEVSKITDATQVSAGFDVTCARLSTGHGECWGSNDEGELGDGQGGEGIESGPEVCEKPPFEQRYGCSRVPVEVREMADATEVSVGVYSACARLSTGHVECWGDDRSGQLGNGTGTEFYDRPVAVSDITDATQVSTGFDSACALLSNGHVECWGENYNGELGDGTTEGHNTPVEVSDIADATQVSVGDFFACAPPSSGHVECWGGNSVGELGDGTTTDSDTPVEVSGLVVSTCTTAAGGGVYKKLGEEGRLTLNDNLSTNLETPQMLRVKYKGGKAHFRLIKLVKATCTGGVGEHEFSGEGTATNRTETGFMLSFSIYERAGGLFFGSTLMKDGEMVEANGGPLTKSTEKIS